MTVKFTNEADPFGDIHSTGVAEGRMVFGDFDNDGDVDALYQDSNGAGLLFGYFRNDGAGSFTEFTDANAAGTPFDTFDFTGQQLAGLFVVDYDNDGDVDILDRETSGGLNVWRNDSGVFSVQADPFGDIHSTGVAEARMVFGDFDNDGDVDALYQDSNGAGLLFGYFRNEGAGVFTDFTDANAAGTPFDTFDFTGQQLAGLFVVDYDNDGDVDILDRETSGGLNVWRNDSGVFSVQTDPFGDIHSTGVAEARMVFGDFDSDGDVDALYQDGNGAGLLFGYFRNNGAGSFTEFTDANAAGTPFDMFDFTGQQLAGLFVVDYDNDGDVDLVDRETSGGLSVWEQGGDGDGSPPVLVSSTPADNASGFAPAANIVLTFDEVVTAGARNIEIRRSSDDVLIETIAANGARVTGSGSAIITIDPVTTLAGGAGYYLTFEEGAFVDSDGATFGRLEGVERNAITDKTFLNFTTAAANTAPTVNANAGLTLNEGATGTITTARLDFNDAEQPDDAITYTLTSAATNGTLFRNGVGLALNDTFTQADINASLIAYTHNDGETTSASFGFSVSDGAGGSVTGQTFAFTVTPVNDDPTGPGLPASQSFTEDQVGAELDLSALNLADVDSPTLTLTLSVTNGAFDLAASPNVAITGNLTSTVTITGPAADINNYLNQPSNTWFVPPLDFAGAATLTAMLNDNDGSGNDDLGTMSLNVTAVNDAPSGADNTIAIDEDHDFGAGYALTAADFGFTDPVESDDFSGVLITTLPTAGGLFLWTGTGYAKVLATDTISFADIDAGDLVFFSDPDENGTNYASFTFQVIDDGGIANNGVDTDQTPNTITFNVAAVNDAPRIRLQPAIDIVGVLADADPDESLVEIVSGDGNGEASPFGGDFAFVSDGATRLVVADFDGDGALDVATASFTTGEVTVLLGDNCGCMDEAPGSPIGGFSFPTAIEAADINGDGKIDLLVTQRGVGVPGFGSVVTLLGAGDGAFTPGDAYQTGTVTVDLALGDFDGVNGVDFVTISQTGSISVGLNDGTGAFSEDPVILLAGAASPSAVAVGDINGDGDLDIAIADAATNSVVLLFGDGAGGFTEQPAWTVGSAPGDIALGDLDGDTDIDIVTANAGGTTVSVLLNNGAGTFAPRVDYAAGAGPNAVALGDMDDDGDLDIVAASGLDAQYHVLLGDRNGGFAPDATPIDSIGSSPSGGAISAIALGQIDPEAEETLPIVVSYTEGAPVVLAPRLLLSDVDGGGTAVGATVFLADAPLGPGGFPGDVLAADVTGTAITAVYDSNTFTLTLSGADTLANYQKVLRTVTYASGDDPDLGGFLPARVIGITVDDGGVDGEGLSAPIALQITAVNDAPTDITSALAVNEYTPVGTAVGTVVGVDADSPGGLTYTLTDDAGGRFAINAAGDVTVANGHLLDSEQAATHTITVQASDGSPGGTFSKQLTVTINNVDPDIVLGTNAPETFFGGAQADLLNGGGGGDILRGGGGDDLYILHDLKDQVFEAAGGGSADQIFANFNYTLANSVEVEVLNTYGTASTGDIKLTGNNKINTLLGNAGANTLNGREGADIMRGFDGNDIYIIDDAGDQVWEAVNNGADQLYANVNFTLGAGQHVESLNTFGSASTNNVNLTGNELAQMIYGNAGVNVLNGGGGADIMRGFGGNDAYIIDDAGDQVWETANNGADELYVNVNYTLGSGQHVEFMSTYGSASTNNVNLTGNELAQTIYGNAGVNVLNGGGGADIMRGFDGNDVYIIDDAGDQVLEALNNGVDELYANVNFTLGAGQHVELMNTFGSASTNNVNLTGNELAQTINGNAGSNIINGGLGNDILRGFGGADFFLFNTAIKPAANIDAIVDFSVIDDTIQLDDAIFTGLSVGPLAAGAFNSGAAATQADDRIIYNAATGALLFDADGLNGAAGVQFATLTAGLVGLGSNDFIIV